MNRKIYINTVNKDKRSEITYLFKGENVDIIFLDYDVSEALSENVEYVVRQKVVTAYKYWKMPVVVEHGALEIEYLNEFPGALSKPMWDMMNDKICTLIPTGQTRRAKVVSCVGYCDGRTIKTFLEKTSGEITHKGKGTKGFQFDPIFVPDDCNKTYAEMTIVEKMKYSQASKSYKKLLDHLNAIN